MLMIVVSWLISSLAFALTAKVLPGFELKGGANGAITAAAVFGIINWLIGWLLFVLLGVVSLGIGFLLAFVTRWIVNAILLKATDALSSSLRIDGFGTALVAALLISLFSTVGEWLVRMVLA
jgi:putative membrane protein